MAEGQRLQRITRTTKDPVKLRRAVLVLMSAQGQPAPDIAHLLKATENYVCDVIHALDDRGLAGWHSGHRQGHSRFRLAGAALAGGDA